MKTQTQIATPQFREQGGVQSTISHLRPAVLQRPASLQTLHLSFASALKPSMEHPDQLRTEEETREDEDAPAMESTPLFGKEQESPLSMELPKSRLQKRRSKFQFARLEYPGGAVARRKYSLRESREASEDSDSDSCHQNYSHTQKNDTRSGDQITQFSHPHLSKPGRRTLCHRSRGLRRPLSINTEAEVESHCLASAVSVPMDFGRDSISSREQKVCAFLAGLQVQEVNFKELIDQESKFTSKRVQEMFRTKRSMHEDDEATSVNEGETSTPVRRREQKLADKQNSALGRIERLSRLSMDLSEMTFKEKPE